MLIEASSTSKRAVESATYIGLTMRLSLIFIVVGFAACTQTQQVKPFEPLESKVNLSQWQCGQKIAVFEHSNDAKASLTFDGKITALVRSQSASGERFAATNNLDFVFWIKGEEARLSRKGLSCLTCKLIK